MFSLAVVFEWDKTVPGWNVTTLPSNLSMFIIELESHQKVGFNNLKAIKKLHSEN
jgi:hypothetical protein